MVFGNNAQTGEGIGGFSAIVAVLLVFLSSWLHAFVAAVLWNWFVAGTFDVHPIGIATAYGIGALIQLYTVMPKSLRTTALEKEFMQHNLARSAGHLLSVLFVRPAGTLFFAWLVKVFFL